MSDDEPGLNNKETGWLAAWCVHKACSRPDACWLLSSLLQPENAWHRGRIIGRIRPSGTFVRSEKERE